MKIPGEPLKRYRLSYGGSLLGSYDTAREAVNAYDSYDKLVRPVTDRDRKFRYSIRDGNKEITVQELRRRADREKE